MERVLLAGDFNYGPPIDFETLQVPLATGLLSVTTHRSDFPLDHLLGFASRRNPKRGFLFVSKVLGKHIPVRPSVIREVHARLAARIGNVPGPVVCIGMAETAIALGHGVFDEFTRQTGRHDDTMFLHSTRYRLDQPHALEFLEEHSHAADHIIYEPQNSHARSIFRDARTLVLVDDEASTGKTFVNLVAAMKGAMPLLERVITVVITDWRGPERMAATAAAFPIPSLSLSVLEGEYQFEPNPDLKFIEMPKVSGDGLNKDHLLPGNFGRLGLLPGQYPEWISRQVEHVIGTQRDGKVLVLGTGEFAYPPFLLAEELERQGVDVLYQSTTRSPIITGLAIGSALTFEDNYGERMPNYLYNAQRGQYDRVLICHETPAGSVDSALVDSLEAETLEF